MRSRAWLHLAGRLLHWSYSFFSLCSDFIVISLHQPSYISSRAAMSSTKTLESRLEESAIEFQKLQTDLSKAVEARQRLDSQKSENEGVLKEFAILKPHNTIYKMIGPGLVKQEQVEAKSNVEKRLEFINSEIVRVEKTLADLSTRSEKKKLEIVAMQQEAQA